MQVEEILERYKDVPEIIQSNIEMIEANSPIQIYSGDYLIQNDKGDLNINGEIIFNWVASSGCHFLGTIKAETRIADSFAINHDRIQLIVDGLEFGNGHVNSKTIGTNISGTEIKGRLLGQACLGDKSVAVEKLIFTIPNLRDFHGTSVKCRTESNFSILSNRLTLENDFCIINIDKCKDFKSRIQSLEEKGGYNILYNCELVPKKGSIKLEDSTDIFHCLSTFLAFLNGRRTSAFFIQGVYEERVLWCDYTDYLVDSYKYVQTWPQKTSVIGLSKTWEQFSTLWKDSNNKNFFISAIHWYVEANGNSGFTEGSIIMSQTALELLYNWWIIEYKKMIVGKDSENINAANKIRLLLSQLDISHAVPAAFTHLQQFVDENENITDAPEAVVQIRNAIVHSQHEKRKKLDSIHYMAKHEALQLSIWYIEMTLLKILDFDEKYFNRCSKKVWASEAEVFPLWSKKS
ncbi:MAG: hypothetical protein ACJ75B_14815 [Flavisolibacter sp.]